MKSVIVSVLALSLVTACGSGDQAPAGSAAPAVSSAKPAPSAPPAAATPTDEPSTSASAAAAPSRCETWGMKGDGTMRAPCRFEGPAPIKAVWTGTYKPDFDGEKAAFTVTSTLDQPVNWGNVAIYYYDKAGKLLEVTDKGVTLTKYFVSGGLLQIGAKETKELRMGWTKEKLPKDTASIEVEIEGYGWTDREPPTFFENTDLGHDDRPKGGAKKDDKKVDPKDAKGPKPGDAKPGDAKPKK